MILGYLLTDVSVPLIGVIWLLLGWIMLVSWWIVDFFRTDVANDNAIKLYQLRSVEEIGRLEPVKNSENSDTVCVSPAWRQCRKEATFFSVEKVEYVGRFKSNTAKVKS